jgi:hypothetical protein
MKKKLFDKNKILIFLFLVVLIISALIRVLQVEGFNSAFTFDQARDMLDLRILASFYDFKISGPTTSITGLNLGPFYYYFNLPMFWLGAGNPQVLVYWNIFWFLLSAIIIFRFFYKDKVFLGFLIATIFLMAPQLFSTTRYFWNANSVVYFIVFFFLGLWNFIENKNQKNALILGILAGAVIQFEAAFGSLCVFFSLLTVLISTKAKINFKKYLIGLLPWFLPQLAFEVKRNFQMTKLFLGIFTGANPVLGEKVPFEQVLSMHWQSISSFFEGQFILPYGIGFLLLIVSFLIIFFDKKFRKIGFYFSGFLFFALAYYTIIYRHELKAWYLEGFRVWYCFICGLALFSLVNFKRIFWILVVVFLGIGFYLATLDQLEVAKKKESNDPKNTANLIANIDWVYQKAEGEGFRAYNYVPEVYDYPSQYLYWWYGQKKYHYLPEKISYSLAEVPKYIKMEEKFLKNTKQAENKIALIYETKASYLDWLGQFKDYCLIDKKKTNWQTIVEFREKCLD